MGNGEFQVSEGVREEWREEAREGRRVFSNKITGQSFSLLDLMENGGESRLAELVGRSIYPLPRTPKVILLNDTHGHVGLLVQQASLSLSALLAAQPLQLQFYQIIHQITATAHTLYRRYGPFGLTEGMVRGQSTAAPILWVHEDFGECAPQLPLSQQPSSEQNMLLQLKELLQSASQRPLPHALTRAASFTAALEVISGAIADQRALISLGALANRRTSPPYPLSPRRAPSGEKLLKLPVAHPKRKQNIPRFIKSLQERRQDGLQKSKGEDGEDERRVGKGEFCSSDSKHSVGKVRSLHVSPSRLRTRPNGNHSCATTNHSVVSRNLSQGISDLLSSNQSGQAPSPQAFDCHGSFPAGEAKLFESVGERREQDLEVTFQKQREGLWGTRSRFSFGSLNSFCRHLSESEELADHKRHQAAHDPLERMERTEMMQESSFSVVIHDEEHRALSFAEEFSRVLY